MKRENHKIMCHELARHEAIESYNRWENKNISKGLDESDSFSFDYLFNIAYKKLLHKNIARELADEEREKWQQAQEKEFYIVLPLERI